VSIATLEPAPQDPKGMGVLMYWFNWLKRPVYKAITDLITASNAGATTLANLVDAVNQIIALLNDLGADIDFINQVRWDDIRMVGSARPAGVADPLLTLFRPGNNTRYFAFPVALVPRELHCQAQIPHGYVEGTDIKLHIHWGHISGADDGSVVWQAEWTWTNPGEQTGASTTSASAAAAVLASEQYFHKMLAIVAIPGAGKKISSVLTVRLFRDSGHASDTSTADAFLMEIDAHYQLDHAGSIGETTKT
jgi:hypothetical protein